VPRHGGTGTISVKCTGSTTAEYQGNTAPGPTEWDTSLSFVIWVSGTGQKAIEILETPQATVLEGGLTASYQ
jgi:hypothetical protein